MTTKLRPTYRGVHTVRLLGGGVRTANLDLYVRDWDKLLHHLGAKAMRSKTGRCRTLFGCIEVRASSVTTSPPPRVRAIKDEDVPF